MALLLNLVKSIQFSQFCRLQQQSNITRLQHISINRYNDINRSAAGLMMFILDSFFGVFSYSIVPLPIMRDDLTTL